MYNDVYYRGQLEKYQRTPPSIARDIGYLKNEANIFNEAIKMSPNAFNELNLPIEKLSKMQHYGIPTRLVDVTIDPLTALFFAVEDCDNETAGNVYIYIPQVYEWDSIQANVMALLAKRYKSNCTVIELCKQYSDEYGKTIDEKELLDIMQKPIFIKYSEQLRATNERLYQQKGSFVICTNKVENMLVTDEVVSIDSILPIMVIRIPYEYKMSIKNELDTQYNINHATVYPELPSVANYLKEKYKQVNMSARNEYSIVQKEEMNIGKIKRLSMAIVLNQKFTIQDIRKIGLTILSEYQKNYEAIWLYIAKEGTDYIMKNWILMLQWIDPSLPDLYKPLPFKTLIKEGIFEQENESYSVNADYYAEHIFEDDKLLLIKNKNNLDVISEVLSRLIIANDEDNLEQIKHIVENNRELIRKAYLTGGDFGKSRDVDFDKYLEYYQYLFSSVDDLILCYQNKKLNKYQLEQQIKKCIEEIKKYVTLIIESLSVWENKKGVSSKDYKVEISTKKKNINTNKLFQ